VTADLRDLSAGGFGISCAKPFRPGMTHFFTFSTDGGLSVTLVAKVMHCRAQNTDGKVAFISGWKFMTGMWSPQDEAAIQMLITMATESVEEPPLDSELGTGQQPIH
jgi:hypothetical protein